MRANCNTKAKNRIVAIISSQCVLPIPSFFHLSGLPERLKPGPHSHEHRATALYPRSGSLLVSEDGNIAVRIHSDITAVIAVNHKPPQHSPSLQVDLPFRAINFRKGCELNVYKLKDFDARATCIRIVDSRMSRSKRKWSVMSFSRSRAEGGIPPGACST